jgi:MFS superfamily sulfate permease-like transporter
MTTGTLLLLIIIILLAMSLPTWPYSKSWGYAPSGVFTILLIVFIVWALSADRPLFSRSGDNIESAVQEAGRDIKEAGRDMADNIRDTVD